MAIKMQGAWFIRVKAKNASFPQEFIVSGASSGNGTYPGTQAGEIFVTGASWTISVRNNPGTGFQSSQMKLKFPTTSGGFRQFDIESNDAGNDQDFDDLILTCRTPVTANDHLIYGHVSDYSGPCIFNPCFPYWVIDTPIKLQEALRIPDLRKYLLEIDPNLLRRIPKPGPPDPIGPVSLNPQPLPPLKFTPIAIAAPGQLATPLKQRFLVRTEEKAFEANAAGKKQAHAADASGAMTYQAVKSIQEIPPAAISADVAALNRNAKISSAIARFRFCDSDTLANVRVRFWEYDRTDAEKAGGAYSGEGERTALGSTLTDDFGNYIFRFTTTPDDTVDEIQNDLAEGENAFAAVAPDIIAEVMQPLSPSLPAFETAAYWNIPLLKRINICVPREKIGVRPLACEGQHILQGVGNIPLAAPSGSGARVSADTSLSSIGIITSTNSLGPRTDCSAWAGTLLLRGCLKNQTVKYYTLEHRRPGEDWQQLSVEFTLPRFFGAFLSSAQVYQGIVNGKATYLNVETDGNDWLMAFRNIKAQIPSTIFPESGPREIRITGLNAAYAPVAGVQETLVLFILNNGIDLDLKPEIEMVGVGKITECGLFTLPADRENPVIQVSFKSVQSNVPPVYGGYGFMSDYAVGMTKGASGFATTNPPSPANPRAAGVCDLTFTGTNTEPGNVAGYVDLELSPASGRWLEPNQTFCTFGVYLNGHLRRTDGQSNEGYSSAVPVLFGIQR